MESERITTIKKGTAGKGPVVYWMSREQRIDDNWALIYAIEQANKTKTSVIIVFNLVASFLEATARQYHFMLKGLKECEINSHDKQIPFYVLTGDPAENIPSFIETHQAGMLIADFDPLKVKRIWKEDVKEKITIPFYEVDGHNIVPCRVASGKQEFAAYTLRPKIQKKIKTFLTEFPGIPVQENGKTSQPINDWNEIHHSLKVDTTVQEIDWLKPGSKEAIRVMETFIKEKLPYYGKLKNDPMKDVLSHLSPYLHFGQISAQRVVIEIIKSKLSDELTAGFMDEIIVRKELSDNYCFYNRDYDSLENIHSWAKKTLEDHREDEREYLYEMNELEQAKTHDPLWNAAQKEMVMTGKMHGYMRMYWAKKILEWSESPETALKTAIYLNDRYELDGRDPNGYAGCAWCIGGVHDRAWTERKVFGKIRYMNYNGAKRKFDVNGYIDRINRLQ